MTSSKDAEDSVFSQQTKIIAKESARCLLFVLESVSLDRLPIESFYEYYIRKGISEAELRTLFDSNQLTKLRIDRYGETFDVFLLSSCLRNGRHGFSNSDKEWEEGDTSVETCITWVKNKKQSAIDYSNYSNEQMIDEVNTLRHYLTKIFRFAQSQFCLRSVNVFRRIDDMNRIIIGHVYKVLVPLIHREYESNPEFPEQCAFINEKLVGEELRQHNHSEFSTETNNFFDITLPFDESFAGMKLTALFPRQEADTTYEEVLQSRNGKECDSVIVVYGRAGVGKTTLIEGMLKDWRQQKSNMKYLATYKHLLRVECKNKTIDSFNRLLYHMMPGVAKEFKSPYHLQFTICRQKVLVIVDGFDEINISSACLLREILEAKKYFKIGVIVTIRPDKIEYIKHLLRSMIIPAKYIRLVGIPMNKREDFICRYHDALAKKCDKCGDKDGLIKFLRENETFLSDIWKLPNNFALLNILWVLNKESLTTISTEAELYQEILRLSEAKLKKQLQNADMTASLQESQLTCRIEAFIHSLARESLITLESDQLSLSMEAYQRLEKVWKGKCNPVEEMSSAILKKSTSPDFIYAFPSRWVQEYLAAFYIWLNVMGKCKDLDAQESFSRDEIAKKSSVDAGTNLIKDPKPLLSAKSSCQNLFRRIIKLFNKNSDTQETTVIRDIIVEVFDGDLPDLSKYQNVFTHLICLLCTENTIIENDIKREALELLKETGINEKVDWFRVLNNLKRDEYVAEYISKQSHILGSSVMIEDVNVFDYHLLLKTMKPAKQSKTVSIFLRLEEHFPDGESLMEEITRHQFRLSRILVTDNNLSCYGSLLKNSKIPNANKLDIKLNLRECTTDITTAWNQLGRGRVCNLLLEPHFLGASVPDESQSDVIRNILSKFKVSSYGGLLTPTIQIPKWICLLAVRIPDAESYRAFQATLPKLPSLFFLEICLSVDFDPVDILQPPPLQAFVYITDVTDTTVVKACNMMKRLQYLNLFSPAANSHRLVFPRASLSPEGVRRLIRTLGALGVEGRLELPKTTVSEEDRDDLCQLACSLLNTFCGIVWVEDDSKWTDSYF